MAIGQSCVAGARGGGVGLEPKRDRGSSERQLLDRFVRDNDQEAFRALIDRHGPMVRGVCRKILGEPHDAEDAFQNTLIIFVRRAGTITHRDSVGPWLHRVAVRVARRAKVNNYGRLLRERARPGARPDEEPGRGEDHLALRSALHEELDRLPEHYRLPLVLCYLEGKTNEEAASQLRCPVGTIKGRLWRARGRLRDRLCRRGAVEPPAPPGVTRAGASRARPPAG